MRISRHDDEDDADFGIERIRLIRVKVNLRVEPDSISAGRKIVGINQAAADASIRIGLTSAKLPFDLAVDPRQRHRDTDRRSAAARIQNMGCDWRVRH